MKLPFDPGSTPILFTNTTDEDCPPHGVLACHGFEFDSDNMVLKFKCRRPTGEDVGNDEVVFAFNGPTKVESNKDGACVLARHTAQWAKVDPDYDYGEFDPDEDFFKLRIGPVADKWYLRRDNEGFVLVGARDDDGSIHLSRVLVLQDTADQSRRVFITESDSDTPVPIFRGSHPDGFTCEDINGDTTVITVFASMMQGVAFTGQIITVKRIKLPIASEARWEVVSTGQQQWEATADGDNIGSGASVIKYWKDYNNESEDCIVVAELFNASSPIASGQDCWVMFRENVRSFENPDSRPYADAGVFIAIPRNCPDYVEIV